MTNKPNNQSAQTQEQVIREAKEIKDALNWALEYTSPVRPEFQSDLFNILTNAVTSADRLIEYASSKSANQSAQEVDVEKFKGGAYYADGKWQTRFLGTYEDFIQAITQSKAVGYSLEQVKTAINMAREEEYGGRVKYGDDEIIQSLTPTPIQTKGRVCNGKDIRCDNPSMDRNGNCRNCQGDMQTIL